MSAATPHGGLALPEGVFKPCADDNEKGTCGDETSQTESAQRAQHNADHMGETVVDQHSSQEHIDETGEPQRDNLGNQDGAS